jgi:ribose transport system ATP-binding protein
MTMFGAENLRKGFFDVEVVKGVSFDLGKGQVLGLIGENGSGKSTCMNMVAGLLTPDSGAMTLDGETYAPVSPHDASAAGIALIHQELNLFENLSVAENLAIGAFPLRLRHPPLIDRGRMRDRAAELLQRVELSVRPDTPLNRLAPGERQLVEIAKAFSSEPRIIIFDEPTTSLSDCSSLSLRCAGAA